MVKLWLTVFTEIDESMKEPLNDAIYRQSELKEYITRCGVMK